jgi:hypothetical protein
VAVKDYEQLDAEAWARNLLPTGAQSTEAFVAWLHRPGADLPPVSSVALLYIYIYIYIYIHT